MKLFFGVIAILWLILGLIEIFIANHYTNGLVCIAIATGNLILKEIENVKANTTKTDKP